MATINWIIHVRFQIDPNPEESQRACMAIARAVLPPDRSQLALWAIVAGVTGAAYVVTPDTWDATTAIGAAAVFTTTSTLQLLGRARLRRLRGADPHARETHYIELSPDGVRTWCSHVDARYPWAEFVTVTEDTEFYLFARGSGVGTVIPKRLLTDVEDAALRGRIREWSPDRGAALARELGQNRDQAI